MDTSTTIHYQNLWSPFLQGDKKTGHRKMTGWVVLVYLAL
jgi:hypothetical protein